jgi:large subunit ribosomal protein L24
MKKYTQLNIRNSKKSRFAKRHIRPVAIKMKVKKGDTVMLVSGKDKGKKGTVVRVMPRENRVIVEGINVHKRHTRRTGSQSGRIIDMELSVHASNVMVMDPKEGKPTRVSRDMGEKGRVRIAKKSGTVLS